MESKQRRYKIEIADQQKWKLELYSPKEFGGNNNNEFKQTSYYSRADLIILSMLSMEACKFCETSAQ